MTNENGTIVELKEIASHESAGGVVVVDLQVGLPTAIRGSGGLIPDRTRLEATAPAGVIADRVERTLLKFGRIQRGEFPDLGKGHSTSPVARVGLIRDTRLIDAGDVGNARPARAELR